MGRLEIKGRGRRQGRVTRSRGSSCAQRSVVLEALEERMMLSGGLLAPVALAGDFADADEWSGARPIAAEASTESGAQAGRAVGAPTASGGGSGASGAPAADSRFLVFDQRDVWWSDTEKSPNDHDDDNMCWAAAASNVLEWTGWGFAGGMTNSDQMFAYFQDHNGDRGGWANAAWRSWYDDFFRYETGDVCGPAAQYIHQTDANRHAMSAIDQYLHGGYGVVLDLRGGGAHAITCWGYDYSETPGGDVEYRGVWVTDSDDDKSDSYPEDELRYFGVEYNRQSRRWDLQGGYSGWYIDCVYALEPVPDGVLERDAAPPDLYYRSDDRSSPFSSDTVSPGEGWSCAVRIHNVGRGDNFGPVPVDVYASTNDTITERDYYLGRVEVLEPAPGDCNTATLTLDHFPDLPTGYYHIGVVVDPDEAITETHEANNTGIIQWADAVGNVLQEHRLAVSRLDLRYDGDSTSALGSSVVTPDAPWACYFSIRNDGPGDAGQFYVDFYASVDQRIGSGDHFLGRTLVSGIEAGHRADAELHLDAFPDLPVGDYYIGVVIDPTNAVLESDNGNNRAVNIADGLLAVRCPDLYHDAWRSAGPSSTTVTAGDPWQCEFAIGNAGPVDAEGAYRVEFVLSSDAFIDSDDYVLGHAVVRGCVADDIEFARLTLDAFPETVAPGDYYVGIVIDSLDAMLESDESNNVAIDMARPIHVQVAPVSRLPYCENFTTGLPSVGWQVPDLPNSHVEVVGGQLRMASATRGRYALNEAILHVNLVGAPGVTLELDHVSQGDERHTGGLSAGDTFRGSRNADLIAISDNGTGWYVLEVLADSGHLRFDLDAAVRDAGMTYTSDFRVKFQQYDNYTWGSDGRAFDNITVNVRTLPQSHRDTFHEQVLSGLHGSGLSALSSRSPIDLDWPRAFEPAGTDGQGDRLDACVGFSNALTTGMSSSRWNTTRYRPGANASTSNRSDSPPLFEAFGPATAKGDDLLLGGGWLTGGIDSLSRRLALLLVG